MSKVGVRPNSQLRVMGRKVNSHPLDERTKPRHVVNESLDNVIAPHHNVEVQSLLPDGEQPVHRAHYILVSKPLMGREAEAKDCLPRILVLLQRAASIFPWGERPMLRVLGLPATRLAPQEMAVGGIHGTIRVGNARPEFGVLGELTRPVLAAVVEFKFSPGVGCDLEVPLLIPRHDRGRRRVGYFEFVVAEFEATNTPRCTVCSLEASFHCRAIRRTCRIKHAPTPTSSVGEGRWRGYVHAEQVLAP